jgi:hypothetical protein
MSEDAEIYAMLEQMAREEQEEAARAHGQHILDAASEATRGRAEQDRSLLDAIGRATKAKGGGSDG